MPRILRWCLIIHTICVVVGVTALAGKRNWLAIFWAVSATAWSITTWFAWKIVTLDPSEPRPWPLHTQN